MTVAVKAMRNELWNSIITKFLKKELKMSASQVKRVPYQRLRVSIKNVLMSFRTKFESINLIWQTL